MAIKAFVNSYAHEITFTNTADGNDDTDIPGGDAHVFQRGLSAGVWPPQCTQAADFPNHHIEIKDDSNQTVIWYIWKNKDNHLVATTNGWSPDAQNIRGESRDIDVSFTLQIDGGLYSNKSS